MKISIYFNPQINWIKCPNGLIFQWLRINDDKILLKLLLVCTLISGQSRVEYPYDWSGEFGSISHDGRLFWNTDWTSGPLLFDGTYTFYPKRFGENISSKFSIFDAAEFSFNDSIFVDTSFVKTILDYKRGDYNYDQLSLDMYFRRPGRIIGIHGFKRSYAGRQGQFFHPGGFQIPLQQSYRLDYDSKFRDWQVNASAARLITESGLPDSSENGLYKDEILAAGLRTISPETYLKWTSHLALFQQWRRVDALWYPNPDSQFIHRVKWGNQFKISGMELTMGLDVNAQSIGGGDTTLRQISWFTPYGKLNWYGIGASLGQTHFSNGSFTPYLSVLYSKKLLNMVITSHYTDNSHPTHIFLWEEKNQNLIERVADGGWAIEMKFDQANAAVRYHRGFNEINNINQGNYTSVELSGELQLKKILEISGSYAIQTGENYVFDGVRNRLKFQVDYCQNQFLDRFDLSASFKGEGLLNRAQSNLLSPIDGIPSRYSDSSVNLSDIWLLHFDVSATISTMTFTWSVRNILQAVEPTALQMIPNTESGDFLVQYQSIFPPIGRLIMVGIYWTFQD